MCADRDAFVAQKLHGDRAGKDQRRRHTPRKHTAAAQIGIALVLPEGGKIGVGRARQIAQRIVVGRVRVGVADDGAHRRAAGHAVHNAADDFGKIGFFSCRGKRGIARCAAGEHGADEVKIERHAGGDAVDDNADAIGMGLAENGQSERISVATGHRQYLRVRCKG